MLGFKIQTDFLRLLPAVIVMGGLLGFEPCGLSWGLAELRAQANLRAEEDKAGPASSQSSSAAIRQYRDAVLFQNRNEFELAAEEWEQFFRLHSGDPLESQARHYAAVCYLQLKQYEKAQQLFEQVVSKFPNHSVAAESYFNLGLTYYTRAQLENEPSLYAGAVKTLETLIARFSDYPRLDQAYFYLGEAYLAQANSEAALKAWERVKTAFPKSPRVPDAMYAQGVLYESQRDFKQARASYNQLLKQYPEYRIAAEVTLRLGETYFAEQQWEAAEPWFEKAAALENNPLADHAWFRLGTARYEQGKFLPAAQAYQELVKQFPNSKYSEPATLATGNAYYLTKDYAKARNWFKRIIENSTNPGLVAEAGHWVARSWLLENESQKALDKANSVLKLAAGTEFEPALLLDKADAMYELAELQPQAIEVYRQLAESFPKHALAPQARYLAAFTALKQQDFSGAAKDAEAFLTANPSHALEADVRFVLAESLLLAQNNQAAVKNYAELVQLFPQHEDKSNWQLRYALALQLNGQHDQVVELLSAAVKGMKPGGQSSEAYFLLAGSQLARKQFPKAIEAYSLALEADAAFGQADEALFNLAAAYRAAEDYAQARKTLEKLMEKHPESSFLERATMRLAEYAYAQNDFEYAQQRYQQLLTKWPESAAATQARYGLAWTQFALQQNTAAVDSFTQVIEQALEPELVNPSRYARANVSLRLKQYAAVIQDADAFVANAPDAAEVPEALYLKGLAQVALQQYAQAVESFQQVLKTNFTPRDKLWYELGWAFKSAGELPQADQAFSSLTSELPESHLAAEAYFHQAEFQYHQKSDFLSAAELYQRAIKQSAVPELIEKALHKQGWSYFQQEQYAQAEAAFQSQTTQYAQGALLADGLLMLGDSLLRQQKYAPALEAFEKAIAAGLSNSEFESLAYLHSVQAAAALKNWELASERLDTMLAKHAESPYRIQAIFERGLIRQQTGQFDTAIEDFTQVADQSNSVLGARARFLAGEIYFLRNDYKEAIRNFFKVAYGYGHPSSPDAVHPWQAASLYEAGRCFEALHEVGRAKKIYQELIDSFPESEKSQLAAQRLQAL